MLKLYELEELIDVNFKAYTIAMNKLRRDIGGTTEGLLKYTKQAGYLVDLNGIIYKPLLLF